ncbi:MAG: GxxExxY protein [Kiritimatiellales bacterium]|nr:GxxExxY protein [Kiritimatiellales bacterium]
MPIECKFSVAPLSQDDFHAVDKTVMKHAFDIQNEFGRLCDELIYKNELAYRCQQDGLKVQTEAMICVSHDTFNKPYFLDMLINCGGIYELKVARSLHTNHSSQLINYLLLAALHHGKLINFRSSSVEHRFVSAQLTPELRHWFTIDVSEWDELDEASRHLEQITSALLSDWGSFLDIDLYRAAICHFLPPDHNRPVEITLNGRTIGHQNICLLNENTGLHISAIKEGPATYRKHAARLLKHTHLTHIQWVNFNRDTVQLITLRK